METDYLDRLYTARGAVAVTVTSATTYNRARAVWIGVSQSLDFCLNGTDWVTFKGCMAGTVVPVQALAVRVTAGPAAPAAGDVVFLY
jgi:hypothetical protein